MKQLIKIVFVVLVILANSVELYAQAPADPGASLSLSQSVIRVGQTNTVSILTSNNGDITIPAQAYKITLSWDNDFAEHTGIVLNQVIGTFNVELIGEGYIVFRNTEAITGVGTMNGSRTIAFNLLAKAVNEEFTVNINLEHEPTLTTNPVLGNDGAPIEFAIESALPVTLADFKATKEGDIAMLDWKTSMEENSSYFEVQHSLKGKEWQKVGTVEAEGIPSTYNFSHTNPANGTNLYRLKMVDRDGTFSYSPMRSLQFDVDLTATFAPNPVADFLKISTNTDWVNVNSVKLFNMSGNPVYSSGAVPDKEISVRNLPDGVYIVQMSLNNGISRSAKIIIAK
jgi:hypothetical protein